MLLCCYWQTMTIMKVMTINFFVPRFTDEVFGNRIKFQRAKNTFKMRISIWLQQASIGKNSFHSLDALFETFFEREGNPSFFTVQLIQFPPKLRQKNSSALCCRCPKITAFVFLEKYGKIIRTMESIF